MRERKIQWLRTYNTWELYLNTENLEAEASYKGTYAGRIEFTKLGFPVFIPRGPFTRVRLGYKAHAEIARKLREIELQGRN